jgi:hypothetical protein
MHIKKPNYEAKQSKGWHCTYLDQETWKARTLQGKDVEEVNVRHMYIFTFPLWLLSCSSSSHYNQLLRGECDIDSLSVVSGFLVTLISWQL